MQVKNPNLIEQVLKHYEGRENKVHLVDGKPHVGIGISLQYKLPKELLAIFGVASRRDMPVGFEITDEQIDKSFEFMLNRMIQKIDDDDYFEDDEFEGLDEVRQAAIISMNYQLGQHWPGEWPSCHAGILERDWDKAADNMLYANVEAKTPSGWYQQTQTRCIETAEAMRIGHWQRFSEYETENRVHEDPNLRGGEGPPAGDPPTEQDDFILSVLHTLNSAPDEVKEEVFVHVAQGIAVMLKYMDSQAPQEE